MTDYRYWTRDRKSLAGLTGEELADELAWQALEDAASQEYVWHGPKGCGATPWLNSTASLQRISKAEQHELDLRPLTFDHTSTRALNGETWGPLAWGSRSVEEKKRAAMQREYIKSAEAGRVVERQAAA